MNPEVLIPDQFRLGPLSSLYAVVALNMAGNFWAADTEMLPV